MGLITYLTDNRKVKILFEVGTAFEVRDEYKTSLQLVHLNHACTPSEICFLH